MISEEGERVEMRRLDYVSNDAALLQIQRYCLQEGKAAGTQMIRVCNFSGLELHLAADRALDIAELRFRGTALSYLSATGITHPSYYEPEGYSWLRSFYGGFLTTCGLDQAGEPCVYGGVSHGLHGRISNCPAEQICTEIYRENERVAGKVRAAVRQAKQQGEAFFMRRTYQFYEDSASFAFTDEIENQSGKRVPLQLLYHFNIGYPFLSPDLEIEIPPAKTIAADEASVGRCGEYRDCRSQQELTVLHILEKEEDSARLVLKNRGICLEIGFDAAMLPFLAQWRHLQPREYVMAFEPTNTHLCGVAQEAEQGTLEFLEPGEKKEYRFTVKVSEDEKTAFAKS